VDEASIVAGGAYLKELVLFFVRDLNMIWIEFIIFVLMSLTAVVEIYSRAVVGGKGEGAGSCVVNLIVVVK